MTTQDQLGRVVGQTVFDADGKKIGTASNLYVSDDARTPEWVTVRTGLFGKKDSFVPLAGARTDDSGLHVTALKDKVNDAPQVEDDGRLESQEATDLYRYYGIHPSGQQRDRDPRSAGQPAGTGPTAGQGAGTTGGTTAGTTGEPESGTTGGTPEGQQAGTTAGTSGGHESMVRSEERLRAGTETAESGRVRLHKYVVTEEQQMTVPVKHEEVHVTREPVSSDDTTVAHPEIGEEDREVLLHEERPVVGKETVPVERVEVDTETVQEEQEVSGTVRKEQVDVEDTTGGTDAESGGPGRSGYGR